MTNAIAGTYSTRRQPLSAPPTRWRHRRRSDTWRTPSKDFLILRECNQCPADIEAEGPLASSMRRVIASTLPKPSNGGAGFRSLSMSDSRHAHRRAQAYRRQRADQLKELAAQNATTRGAKRHSRNGEIDV